MEGFVVVVRTLVMIRWKVSDFGSWYDTVPVPYRIPQPRRQARLSRSVKWKRAGLLDSFLAVKKNLQETACISVATTSQTALFSQDSYHTCSRDVFVVTPHRESTLSGQQADRCAGSIAPANTR